MRNKGFGIYYYMNNKYIAFGLSYGIFETIYEILSLYRIHRPYDKVIVKRLWFDSKCEVCKSKTLFTFKK